MDVISLFSGAGGMDIGFEKAGFNIKVAVELDAIAAKTYRSNNPYTKLIEGDVGEVIPELIKYKGITVLIGGPPCQGYSLAGKMALDDPRSQLIFTFCDAIEQIQPKIFVMENVDNLAKSDKFADAREALFNRFSKMGYDFKVHLVDARRFGVAQKRSRMFIVGGKSRRPVNGHHLLEFEKPLTTVRKVIEGLGAPGSATNLYEAKARIVPVKKPVLRRTPWAGMLFNGQGRPVNLDALSGTLPASMGGNRTPIIDQRWLNDATQTPWVESYFTRIQQGEVSTDIIVPDFMRRMTVTEAARLQTFPANYVFSGSIPQMFSQVGNAVPCDMAYAIALAIKTHML
jgi:DNA (cytosine-5)-methyltransferase 1